MSDGSAGWLKLWRSLRDHELWLKEPFTRGQAWVDLLMQANFRDSTVLIGNKSMTIHRGQVFTSLERLRTRWQRDRKTVRAWLLAFGSDGMLDRATAYGADGGYTLLTIRNFEKYQESHADALDGGVDRATDGDLDGGVDRALDRALDRGLPQSVEGKNNQEGEEGKKRTRASSLVSSNGQPRRTSRRYSDRADWGRE